MVNKIFSLILLTGVAAGFASLPVPARADPSKQECAEDDATAQAMRMHGSFDAAREALHRCAVEACPALVRDDCTRRLHDLEQVQPSVVFHVRDRSGVDLVAVRVTVDGTLLTDRFDGTPLKLDPGAHLFTFEASGETVSKTLLVLEGEVARHEWVVIGSEKTPPQASHAEPLASPPRVPPSSGWGSREILAVSLAGIGVAGLTGGAVFGLLANSAWNDVKTLCGGDPSRCTHAPEAQQSHATAETEATLATASLIAGGAFVAGGAVAYFSRGKREEDHAGRIAVAPNIDGRKVGIVVTGAF